MTIPNLMEIFWVHKVKEDIKHTATQPNVTKRVCFILNFYICLRKKMVQIWVPDVPKWTIHGSTQPHHANVKTVVSYKIFCLFIQYPIIPCSIFCVPDLVTSTKIHCGYIRYKTHRPTNKINLKKKLNIFHISYFLWAVSVTLFGKHLYRFIS
jgi:hypothetical protein